MTNGLTNPEFDYSAISKDEGSKLRYYEGELLRSKKRVADEIVKHGEILHGAQQVLANHSNGTFGAWLASVGISKSSAYRSIALFLSFASFPNWDNLEVSAAYELANNERAKNKAIKLAAKGTKVTHAMAKELIDSTAKPAGKPAGKPAAPAAEPPVEVDDSTAWEFGDDGHDETGEDGRTEADGTDSQETGPDSPGDGTERTEATGKDQVRLNRQLAHSLRDKLARAICDYHEVRPNRAERDRLVRIVQEVELWN